MIYDVRHQTRYRYRSVVPLAKHVLRLLPVTREHQTVRSSWLSVAPDPAERLDLMDFFGNRTLEIALEFDHRELTIAGAAIVDVHPRPWIDPSRTPDLESVAQQALGERRLAADASVHFIGASRLVTALTEVADYARPCFANRRPCLEGAIELMHKIRDDFAYDPAATDVTTPVAEAFAIRRGVCQDFAHIMISGLRALRMPAAYVSGYLRTIPPPGRARLQGADAMHAWVRVWCGAATGWVDLDPTNAMTVDEDHITLAIGRDYADVSPVSGVLVTSSGQSLSSSVDVEPLPGP